MGFFEKYPWLVFLFKADPYLYARLTQTHTTHFCNSSEEKKKTHSSSSRLFVQPVRFWLMDVRLPGAPPRAQVRKFRYEVAVRRIWNVSFIESPVFLCPFKLLVTFLWSKTVIWLQKFIYRQSLVFLTFFFYKFLFNLCFSFAISLEICLFFVCLSNERLWSFHVWLYTTQFFETVHQNPDSLH